MIEGHRFPSERRVAFFTGGNFCRRVCELSPVHVFVAGAAAQIVKMIAGRFHAFNRCLFVAFRAIKLYVFSFQFETGGFVFE
jgi:hypothetical protein